MFAHPAGVALVIAASPVKVTVSGLFGWPFAAIVNGAVRVWLVPLVPVAKVQLTWLFALVQEPLAVVNVLLV